MNQCLAKRHKPLLMIAVMASGLLLSGCSEENTATKPTENPAVTQSSTKTPTATTVTPINKDAVWLDQFVQKNIITPAGLRKANFSWGKHDLNNNNKDEYLVIMKDMYFCGSGGCTAYLIEKDKGILQRFTLMNPPVFYTNKRHDGWQDMVVYSNNAWRKLSYNGKKYPSNPSVAPSIDRDAIVKIAKDAALKSEIYQQDGKGLAQIPSEEIFTPFNQVSFSFEHTGDPKHQYTLQMEVNKGNAKILGSDTMQK